MEILIYNIFKYHKIVIIIKDQDNMSYLNLKIQSQFWEIN